MWKMSTVLLCLVIKYSFQYVFEIIFIPKLNVYIYGQREKKESENQTKIVKSKKLTWQPSEFDHLALSTIFFLFF